MVGLRGAWCAPFFLVASVVHAGSQHWVAHANHKDPPGPYGDVASCQAAISAGACGANACFCGATLQWTGPHYITESDTKTVMRYQGNWTGGSGCGGSPDCAGTICLHGGEAPDNCTAPLEPEDYLDVPCPPDAILIGSTDTNLPDRVCRPNPGTGELCFYDRTTTMNQECS